MRIPGNYIAQTAACFSISKKSTYVPVSMVAYGEPANGVNRSENQCSSLKEEYIKLVASGFREIFLETLG